MALNMHKGTVFVLIVALISGFSIFLNSYAVKGIDSSVFTFLKNALVAILLLSVILLWKLPELRRLSRKQWVQLSLIGLIGGSIPFLLFFKGLQLVSGSTATTAAFLHKTLFIFVAILALVLLKEKLSRWWLAAPAILAGTYLLAKPSFSFALSHLLILGAVLFWAVENVYAKHVLNELSGTVVGFGRMFFGAVFILAFLLVTGKTTLIGGLSLAHWGWVIITTSLLCGYVFFYYNGLKLVPASTATALLTLGLPITVLLDVTFRNVPLQAFDVLGMIFITVGVLWLAMQPSAVRSVTHGRT